jgi:hypothetical protein
MTLTTFGRQETRVGATSISMRMKFLRVDQNNQFIRMSGSAVIKEMLASLMSSL